MVIPDGQECPSYTSWTWLCPEDSPELRMTHETRLKQVLTEIDTARRYALDILSHIGDEDWFRMPAGNTTHVAWQVGHLAVAQYNLALRRMRGTHPDDEELIPTTFRELFGKGSAPTDDERAYPAVAGLRRVLDAVHTAVLSENAELPDAVLDETAEPAHPMFRDKLGALRWTAQHEFIHVGQIALLRRIFGGDPLR